MTEETYIVRVELNVTASRREEAAEFATADLRDPDMAITDFDVREVWTDGWTPGVLEA